MDAAHAKKAAEAGVVEEPDVPPPPYPATPVSDKPPLPKKCFLTMVLCILIGICVSIAYVVNQKKAEAAQQEWQRTSTTVTTTTTLALRDLSDEQILEQCGGKYTAKLGKSDIAIFSGWTGMPDGIQKNALWLRGAPTDEAAIKKARVLACLDEIPTFIINMRPAGLRLFGDQNEIIAFEDESIHQSWEEYDATLEALMKKLKNIPSLVIMEPKLLQLSYDVLNKQYEYDNNIYLDEFITRAQKVVNQLQKSWVYLDAGDPKYLDDEDHLDHISATLLRVQNMRGFAMNTGFFANMTFVEGQARQIACKTGLNYVTDTGRNGGEFSRQELENIATCRFDPPNVKASNKPMWGLAAMTHAKNQASRTRRSGRGGFRAHTQSLHNEDPTGQPRRFSIYNEPTKPAALMGAARPSRISNAAPSGQIRSKSFNSAPAAPRANLKSATDGGNGPPGKKGVALSKKDGETKMAQISRGYRVCIRPLNKNKRSDGYIWARSNGESDGRLAKRGTASLCLKKHAVACDDSCPSNSQQSCNCEGKQTALGGAGAAYGPGAGAGYGQGYGQGYAPGGYPQMPYQPVGGYNPYGGPPQWHGRRK